jgi:hypothetical protein
MAMRGRRRARRRTDRRSLWREPITFMHHAQAARDLAERSAGRARLRARSLDAPRCRYRSDDEEVELRRRRGSRDPASRRPRVGHAAPCWARVTSLRSPMHNPTLASAWRIDPPGAAAGGPNAALRNISGWLLLGTDRQGRYLGTLPPPITRLADDLGVAVVMVRHTTCSGKG